MLCVLCLPSRVFHVVLARCLTSSPWLRFVLRAQEGKKPPSRVRKPPLKLTMCVDADAKIRTTTKRKRQQPDEPQLAAAPVALCPLPLHEQHGDEEPSSSRKVRKLTPKADIYTNTSHLLPDLAVYGSWLSTAVNPKRRSVASGDYTVGRNVANIRRLCSWLIAGERARIPRLNALGKLGPDAIVGRWLQYADEHLTAGAHIKQQTVSKHLDALALYYRYYCAISLKRHTAGTELREALEQIAAVRLQLKASTHRARIDAAAEAARLPVDEHAVAEASWADLWVCACNMLAELTSHACRRTGWLRVVLAQSLCAVVLSKSAA